MPNTKRRRGMETAGYSSNTLGYSSNILTLSWATCFFLLNTNLYQELHFFYEYRYCGLTRCFTTTKNFFKFTNRLCQFYSIFKVNFNQFKTLLNRVWFYYWRSFHSSNGKKLQLQKWNNTSYWITLYIQVYIMHENQLQQLRHRTIQNVSVQQQLNVLLETKHK